LRHVEVAKEGRHGDGDLEVDWGREARRGLVEGEKEGEVGDALV